MAIINWEEFIDQESKKDYFITTMNILKNEKEKYNIYPPGKDVFSAMKLTPLNEVKVVILGMDPYHGPGQAHGLAFSVLPEVKPPPSLVNIFKELKSDLT